jgi:hypothetical protein
MIREPIVAGRFYPDRPEQCLSEVRKCLSLAEKNALADKPPVAPETADGRDTAAAYRDLVGGIVPHAGWIYSGAVAARVLNEIARRKKPDVVVIFGAVHTMRCSGAAVFPSGAWETPLGLTRVDGRLAGRLQGQTGLLEADPHAHEDEHSIEVQLPFIQHLMPDALIVPIMVPPDDKAAVLGTAVGRTCKHTGVDAVFVGSTDLTHYGPSYGFTPQGTGADGLAWAKDVNDRRMIDLILALRADDVVEEAAAHHNACGAGAIAATAAACKAVGADRATLLEHTTSYEVLSELHHEPMRDAVGYAGIVFD